MPKIFDTTQDTFFLPELSWLSYKLLFVRQDPSSITLGGKLSRGGSCHLEADLCSRLTDSAPSLPASVPLSPLSITPTPVSAVCLDQTTPASISDFQSISGTSPLTVVCPSVSLLFRAAWSGSWIHQGTQTDSIHHLHTDLNNNTPRPLPSSLPLSPILSVLFI